ncbi:MAG: hypothetical protein ACO3NK_15470, partial [Prochlorotrichaceae cyanobacterium]
LYPFLDDTVSIRLLPPPSAHTFIAHRATKLKAAEFGASRRALPFSFFAVSGKPPTGLARSP